MKNKHPKCSYKQYVYVQKFLTMFLLIEVIDGVRLESFDIGSDLFPLYEMWPPFTTQCVDKFRIAS